MNTDYVILVGRIGLGIATFFLTLVPLLYLRLPWYKSPLGRVMMLQSTTLAMSVGLKAVLTFLKKDGDPTTLIYINTMIIWTIAFSAVAMAYLMWTYYHSQEKEKTDDSSYEERPSDLE